MRIRLQVDILTLDKAVLPQDGSASRLFPATLGFETQLRGKFQFIPQCKGVMWPARTTFCEVQGESIYCDIRTFLNLAI
jgi:hypothetical protein